MEKRQRPDEPEKLNGKSRIEILDLITAQRAEPPTEEEYTYDRDGQLILEDDDYMTAFVTVYPRWILNAYPSLKYGTGTSRDYYDKITALCRKVPNALRFLSEDDQATVHRYLEGHVDERFNQTISDAGEITRRQEYHKKKHAETRMEGLRAIKKNHEDRAEAEDIARQENAVRRENVAAEVAEDIAEQERRRLLLEPEKPSEEEWIDGDDYTNGSGLGGTLNIKRKLRKTKHKRKLHKTKHKRKLHKTTKHTRIIPS
jgi:hypothetical protein